MRYKLDFSQVGMEKYFQLEGIACANALHPESHREPREQGTGGHQGNALETPRVVSLFHGQQARMEAFQKRV